MEGRSIPGKLLIAANQRAREKAFWLEKLSGNLAKSIFPYDYDKEDYQKGSVKERQSAAFSFACPGDLYGGLMKLSAGSDVRLHIILAAALTALLYKYTPNNHSDIIIGTPIYKQQKQGEFINTVLPLRNAVTPGMPFKELLLQARQTMVEAAGNQSYPLEVLVSELDMDPYDEDFPLFDTAFLLENIQDKKDIRHIPVNLLFFFSREETTESLHGGVDYNSSLYRKSTIERIAGQFTRVLRQILDHIDISIARIDILSQEEKKQLLIDFNDTETLYPGDKTIHEWFEEQVERTPEKIAVGARGTVPLSMDHVHITYKELNEKANQLACELRLKGVVPNTVAVIILEPSIELIIGILAVLKAGGAYLPIDSNYPVERIISILDGSDAALVLTHSRIMDKFSYTVLLGLPRKNSEPLRTGLRARCDFDRLPMPDRSLVDYNRYNRYIGHAMVKNSISMLGSRGCPFNCAYCHRIWPKKHIFRSAENLFAEVKFYYDLGIRRFDLIDDIFNFNIKNSSRFFQYIVDNNMNVQLFFPNGLRGDILTKDYIDLMIEAGTINIDLALETASPRLQKLIGKNLDIERFRENIEYICKIYPQVILDLNVMYGFPTESEEEAMMSYDFIKSIRWLDFPYVFILKIHPNTAMGRLALENGVPAEAIARSMNYSYHDVPETLPFSRQFAREFKTRFLSEYFLSRERLLHVLPHQMRAVTEDELVKKYDNYLPMKINSLQDILKVGGISKEELGDAAFTARDFSFPPDFNQRVKQRFQAKAGKGVEVFRVLLLDLSELFSSRQQHILHGEIVVPHGIMSLMTYLNETFGCEITGKIAKSKVDFDSYDELKTLVTGFKPHLIGIRSLSFYKDFFHRAVAYIRQWGIDVPVIAGGPYATMDYKLLLQDPNVDLAVLGEGEHTLAELVEKMMGSGNKLPPEHVLKTIDGIAFMREKDREILRKTNRELLCLDKIAAAVSVHPVQNLGSTSGPGDLLYLISTSGSTGKPKSVMLEHRNLANLLHFQYTKTGIDFNKVLQFASIGFDVSAQEIFSTLISGGELFLVTGDMKSDLPQLFDYIRQNGIEVLFLPPAFVRFIFSDSRYFAGFPGSVRHIITAGEQLIVSEAFRQYLKENKVVLHNHYGPTETHVVTTLALKPGDRIDERPAIGYPTTNTRIYILDEAQNPKPVGAVGELYIGGANVGRGYLNKPELTAERFLVYYRSYRTYRTYIPSKKIYKTGDLARWLPDGTLEFIGRVDHQVKIRGYRIEPREVERALLEIMAVNEAVVIDRTDVRGDKYLCAYVVSAKELDDVHLRDMLSLSLPDYMIPAYFVQIDRIPLTPNGKINRNALPEPQIGSGGAITYTAPGNEIEIKLAGIWSEVLGLAGDALKAPIGIDVDFFNLGGHSLKATILLSRIHKEFNVKMALGEMFENPTIRELAARIKESGEVCFASIQPAEEKEYYPLSSVQRRLYFLQQMDLTSTAYNMTHAVCWEEKMGAEEIREEKLEDTFKQLIARHESLRTSFEIIGGEAVQRINSGIDAAFAVDYYEAGSGATGEKIEEIIKHFERPFDLTRAPLMRVGLIKTIKKRHLLLFDMHHIITDGRSQEILIKEFKSLYAGTHLPLLKLQYKDYVQWQSSRKQQELMKQQETYWAGTFSDELPVLNLPTDYSRPVIRSFEGNSECFIIRKEETQGLRKIAAEAEATLYMTLLAVLNILLAKLSGQEDIIVGTPIAARRHADLEPIIGMFVNTLPMRNYPAGNKRFPGFLKEVKECTLAAYENQEYPFEDLVDSIAVRRDTSRNPVFDVVFVLQNQGEILKEYVDIDTGKGARSDSYEVERIISKFDMTLEGIEIDSSEELFFSLEYCSKLFKAETIKRFIAYFKKLISSVLKGPGTKTADMEIIPEAEKRQILYDFNDTMADYPKDKTIHRLFEEQAERTPDSVAVIGGGQLQITYRELNTKSDRLAHALKEKGVRPDTIVDIMVERSVEMAVEILGILKAGGAYLPIEPDCPRERIDYMLKDSDVKTLPAAPAARVSSAHLAYVIYTSGTTGRPKGVAVEHRSAVNTLLCRKDAYKMSPGVTALQLFSYAFDGFVTGFFTPLISGAAVVLISEEELKDITKIKEIIIKNKITHFISVPALYQAIIESMSPEEAAALQTVTLAGDKVPSNVIEITKHKNKNINIAVEYGVTEAAVMSTIYCHQEREEQIRIGKPIWNTRIYIIDPQGMVQPIGVGGELCIGGDGLSRGYMNNPELTAEKFLVYYRSYRTNRTYIPSKKIYKTGDLARWHEDGNIEFLGRMDHQVKIRGFRIESGEIENRLSRHENIKETVIIDRIDSTGEKYLCAYIVLHSPVPLDLRQYLSRTLPDYMIPSYFVQLESMPLTPTGKVDRKSLPEPEAKPVNEYVAPATDHERKIAEIWKKILGLEKVGIHDNFFDVGGNSIKILKLSIELKALLGRDIPVAKIFQYTTIASFVAYLDTDTDKERYEDEAVEFELDKVKTRLKQRRYRGS